MIFLSRIETYSRNVLNVHIFVRISVLHQTSINTSRVQLEVDTNRKTKQRRRKKKNEDHHSKSWPMSQRKNKKQLAKRKKGRRKI